MVSSHCGLKRASVTWSEQRDCRAFTSTRSRNSNSADASVFRDSAEKNRRRQRHCWVFVVLSADAALRTKSIPTENRLSSLRHDTAATSTEWKNNDNKRSPIDLSQEEMDHRHRVTASCRCICQNMNDHGMAADTKKTIAQKKQFKSSKLLMTSRFG